MQIEIVNNVLCSSVYGENLYSDFFPDTTHSTSYNAYIVQGTKTALIGAVHDSLMQEFIDSIDTKIDYLICCCTGTEYIKCIAEILKRNPDIEVVGTIAAIKNLKEMLNVNFNEHIAKNGAKLELGNGIELEFIIAPCLSWQDTMLTYLPSEKLMFTGRLLGSLDNTNGLEEYYKAVLSPHSEYVKTALELISEHEVKALLPCNGALVKSGVQEVISEYRKLCARPQGHSVAVVFPKKHANTSQMAEIIIDTLKECDISVRDTSDDDAADVLNTSDAIIIGTPTINKNASKEVWRLVAELDAINVKGKPYFVFGSYGWSGEGQELLQRHLKQLRLRPFEKPLCAVFTPSQQDVEAIQDYAKRFKEYIENIWEQN